MKLTVKNLGPIEEATVDLSKDLIVLTGQNNTGKTYLTNLICGLTDIQFPILSVVDNLINQLKEAGSQIIKIDLKEELPKIIASELMRNLPEIFASSHSSIVNGMVKCNFEKEDLDKLERAFLDAKTLGQMTNDNWRMAGRVDAFSVIPSFKDGVLTYNIKKYLIDDNGKFEEFIQSYLTASINSFMFFFLPSVKYFSAERQGITLFHRDLTLINDKIFKQLIGSKNASDLNGFLAKRISRFPLGVKKNLELIEEVDSSSQIVLKHFTQLIKELEVDILKGKAIINKNGDILQKVRNIKEPLAIQLSSSSFKSLSLLSLYLKHSAHEGDTIIIDEPELNLHPDNQRKIARFIGRLVNEGFKVIISTHSDYIIKELNNLIMLSSVKNRKKFMNRLDVFQENQLLKPACVEAHLFTLKNNKSELIEVDETGFSVETIDEVIGNLDTDTEEIYYKLKENQS